MHTPPYSLTDTLSLVCLFPSLLLRITISITEATGSYLPSFCLIRMGWLWWIERKREGIHTIEVGRHVTL